MKATRSGESSFTIEFESDQELQDEYQTNLSMGGARLPTAERIPLYSQLVVTLRGCGGAEVIVKATVVAPLPDGVALAIEGEPEAIAGLLAKNNGRKPGTPAAEEEETAERKQSTWDRIKRLQRNEKLMLAPKAERSERAMLVQDNDPMVLFSLLKNPRVTMDEVVRIAKSSYLIYQTAELIMKTSPWMGNLDVRLALINNPKTPPAFALRILPTLPESDVRNIARAGTNMALKQAAIRRLQKRG